MNMRFDLWWAVWMAAGLPLVAGALFWLWHRRRLARLTRLGGETAIARLAPPRIRRAPVRRALRLAIVLGLGALAYAGPRWGATTTVVRSEGLDVVLAMDVSASMLAEDERPSRIERMKQEIRRFRASAPGDRIALLVFAGRSYILTPLTADAGAVELFLDNLDPSLASQGGTALAPTILQGTDLLRVARGAAGRALVILSDGEAFDDVQASLAAARDAHAAEIAVVTVGFGTTAGARIPIRQGNTMVYKLSGAGQPVVTRYNPELLRAVAQAAQGEFIPAEANDKGLRIRQALSTLDAKQQAVTEGLSRPLRVTWLLLPALLLLLFDAWRVDGGGSLGRTRRWLRLSAPVVLLALFSGLAHAQGDAALERFKAGHFLDAAGRWRQRIADGDTRPTTLYNYGTALLAADSLDAAAEVLARAAETPDEGIRQRALYNLGLAQLRRARQSEHPDTHALDAALAAYRTLLLQHPADRDAQWNYELALQTRKRQGGGGGASNPQNPQTPQSSRGPADETKAMSRDQAEQLLGTASRDERETQAKRLRAAPRDKPPGGKDW